MCRPTDARFAAGRCRRCGMPRLIQSRAMPARLPPPTRCSKIQKILPPNRSVRRQLVWLAAQRACVPVRCDPGVHQSVVVWPAKAQQSALQNSLRGTPTSGAVHARPRGAIRRRASTAELGAPAGSTASSASRYQGRKLRCLSWDRMDSNSSFALNGYGERFAHLPNKNAPRFVIQWRTKRGILDHPSMHSRVGGWALAEGPVRPPHSSRFAIGVFLGLAPFPIVIAAVIGWLTPTNRHR
jgi:hypothetical protein